MLLTRTILTTLILSWVLGLSAQLNPEFVYLDGKSNDEISVIITSLGATPVISNAPSDGEPEAQISPLGDNLFEVVWTSESNYTGQSTSIIEYFDSGAISGFTDSRYIVANLTFKETLVQTANDIIIAVDNSASIDVLANDSSSDANINLSKIAYSEGGQASISGGILSFTFDPDTEFGTVGYIATADNNIGNSGIARFVKLTNGVNNVVNVSTHNKEEINLYLPFEEWTIVQDPENGTLDTSDAPILKYSANTEFTGSEVIRLGDDNGAFIQFNIDVVDKEVRNTVVVDDHVYTNSDQTVFFNVLENDYKDVFEIVDFSPELDYLGNGNFSYTPDQGELGGSIYYYKIFTGVTFLRGFITISVNDFEPITNRIHKFTVESGTTFIMEHEAPVGGYSFSLLSDPDHGVVEILAAGNSGSDCNGEIQIEESSIEYLAQPGYEGKDAFELEYCTSQGNCHIVKVEINIVPNNTGCNCQVGCVWQGDFNDDGVVDLKDLMTFGYNVGEHGASRTSSDDAWIGQTSEPWGYTARNGDNDLKHVDASGDGFITLEDASYIESNFGSSNRLVSQSVYGLAEYPISLSTDQTEIDSGEWLVLDITLGDIDLPVLDFYGLTFQFNMDPGLIVESSVTFNVADDSWVRYDSPIETVLAQPVPGNINIGLVRLNKKAISGSGIIGTISMIVEDELDGFRLSEPFYDMHLSLSNTAVYAHDGQAKEVKSNTVVVTLNLQNDDTEQDLDLDDGLVVSAHPNPASEFIQVDANRLIEKVAIYDISGRLVSVQLPLDNAFRFELPQNLDGIYLFKFISGENSVVRKIHLESR